MATQYEKCKALLKEIDADKITLSDLRQIMTIKIGSSKDCIKQNMNVMISLGMIKVDKNGNFEINKKILQ
jgi:hypothetical protein